MLDWIVPSARGDDAPLASAAPIEALERAKRAAADVTALLERGQAATPLARASSLRLKVSAGPAWHGYIAVEFDARGRLAPRSSGWLALVEHVGAGTDGTPVPRALVRAVAGPLDLDALGRDPPLRVVRALRWPETAQPTRLRATGWIEAADGRIVAIAAERCAWAPAR